MGMIVTLYLISCNVYNSVDAPKGRGFSYIEVWMLGAQFPVLLALCEYGFVLAMKKVDKKLVADKNNMVNLDDNLDARIKKLDFATMGFSFLFFVTFASSYWIIVLSK